MPNSWILGAGESSTAMYQLLQMAHSPYEAVGFLDDDPEKLGKMIDALPVRGKTSQLQEIGKKRGTVGFEGGPSNDPGGLRSIINTAHLSKIH